MFSAQATIQPNNLSIRSIGGVGLSSQKYQHRPQHIISSSKSQFGGQGLPKSVQVGFNPIKSVYIGTKNQKQILSKIDQIYTSRNKIGNTNPNFQNMMPEDITGGISVKSLEPLSLIKPMTLRIGSNPTHDFKSSINLQQSSSFFNSSIFSGISRTKIVNFGRTSNFKCHALPQKFEEGDDELNLEEFSYLENIVSNKNEEISTFMDQEFSEPQSQNKSEISSDPLQNLPDFLPILANDFKLDIPLKSQESTIISSYNYAEQYLSNPFLLMDNPNISHMLVISYWRSELQKMLSVEPLLYEYEQPNEQFLNQLSENTILPIQMKSVLKYNKQYMSLQDLRIVAKAMAMDLSQVADYNTWSINGLKSSSQYNGESKLKYWQKIASKIIYVGEPYQNSEGQSFLRLAFDHKTLNLENDLNSIMKENDTFALVWKLSFIAHNFNLLKLSELFENDEQTQDKFQDAQKQINLQNQKPTLEQENDVINNIEKNMEQPDYQMPFGMKVFFADQISDQEKQSLLYRPEINFSKVFDLVKPIICQVKDQGDSGLRELTNKFDKVDIPEEQIVVNVSELSCDEVTEEQKIAFDTAYDNITKFHQAQVKGSISVETMPGINCRREVRAIERVGLYVPGGTAVLPSTALMLGVPAQIAGCKTVVLATPPRKDGSICPQVVYCAKKCGVDKILKAGGAQAIAALAYGTETCPKVDKICGPGNQFVTAAKMVLQNDGNAMVAIDMPAGPSEQLCIADKTSKIHFVVADLLSQSEHGEDSQVVGVFVENGPIDFEKYKQEFLNQVEALERKQIVKSALSKSFILIVKSKEEAMQFSNRYSPEHLVIQTDDAEDYVQLVENAGSLFLGHYTPESVGDYASGTNHSLPTYGYANMYSGVSYDTFVKHITVQNLTKEGLKNVGSCVEVMASVEGLGAHKNAVSIRLKDLEGGEKIKMKKDGTPDKRYGPKSDQKDDNKQQNQKPMLP